MARIRNQNEIISSLLDFFRIAQPSLDLKPGEEARDLFVDGPSEQMSKLYDELGKVSSLQSLRQALGIDLDKLGDNFGIKRNRGSTSTVPAIFTFNNLDSDIAIIKNNIVYAKNGSIFFVVNSTLISSVLASKYKSVASRYKADLDYLGIKDQYAVEVLLVASASGTSGNISKYSLNNTSISGINNVTNVVPAGGGSNVEDDNAFKNRILAVFSGANTGTSLGYKNAVIADNSVIDAIVIEPGDDLMVRDGTQVSVAKDGTKTIISEGTGGKVDIYIFGTRIQETVDSFIYRDKSNTGNPSNIKNDYVLGQIISDSKKNVVKKRLDNLAAKILPTQPVNNIVSVTGSSGTSFVEKSIDSLGRVAGNYELIRDDGNYSGSPWGFDRIHWIDNKISNYSEDKTKGIFNGQDSLGFVDVLSINKIYQNIIVLNENSKIDPKNKASIQLSHYPATNVTRVFNVTTGERYTVTSQRPDDISGAVNTTGRILISGKTLPSTSDVLQVDYTWVFSFDKYIDFDNKNKSNNPRIVQDSIDWGYSNIVKNEQCNLLLTGSYLTATTVHPINSMISVNKFSYHIGNITLSSGRLCLILPKTINNVSRIIRQSDGAELWNTAKSNGIISGLTIFLPTDSIAKYNDYVQVIYNLIDVFNTTGNFNSKQINIIPTSDVSFGDIVEVTYIANINTILPSSLISSLPAIRSGNSFSIGSNVNIGCQPTTHIYSDNKILYNLRNAPSHFGITVSGAISPGTISISGTSFTGVFDIVYTASYNSLKQNLSSVMKKILNSNSISSNIALSKIAKVEKVTTTSNLDVLSVDYIYDLKNYELLNNSFSKNESIENILLNSTEFVIPSTNDNITNTPSVGDKIRISFYYTIKDDYENIFFSKSGTLYTTKRFVLVDTISVSSGFASGGSATSTITVNNLNQPITRTRYTSYYDYTSPKANERITITYNYDKLITDSTFAIEGTRPINADVLVKSSIAVLVNATLKIGILPDFINSSTTILQNVQNAVVSALNATALGTKVDSSDLQQSAYTVAGVDSARVLFFNKNGKTGTVLNIQANKNEFIRANKITIQQE